MTLTRITARMFRAATGAGTFIFSPDQVASVVPLRDGGSRVNLRQGRYFLLPLPPDELASRFWPVRPHAA